MSMANTTPSAFFKPSFQRYFLIDGGFEGGLNHNPFYRAASILCLGDFSVIECEIEQIKP